MDDDTDHESTLYAATFQEWLAKRAGNSENMEDMVLHLMNSFIEFTIKPANIAKASKKRKHSSTKTATTTTTTTTTSTSPQGDSPASSGTTSTPTKKTTKTGKERRPKQGFMPWEQKIILDELDSTSSPGARNSFTRITQLLKEKEDKGRTNVDVKDWYRNYLNRQEKEREEDETRKQKEEAKKKRQELLAQRKESRRNYGEERMEGVEEEEQRQ